MPEPIDHTVLDELQEAVGAEFVSELIDTFLNEAPGMMSELQEGVQTSDTEAVRRAAHSLKSNANTFGATELAEAARKIEVSGLGDDPAATLAALQAVYAPAAVLLKARRDG